MEQLWNNYRNVKLRRSKDGPSHEERIRANSLPMAKKGPGGQKAVFMGLGVDSQPMGP